MARIDPEEHEIRTLGRMVDFSRAWRQFSRSGPLPSSGRHHLPPSPKPIRYRRAFLLSLMTTARGVVHVLREVHKALRPKGILLDIHPLPEDPRLEVVRDRGTQAVGTIDGRKIAATSEEQDCVSGLQSEGLYAVRREPSPRTCYGMLAARCPRRVLNS
jgi:hypothetical protein